MWTKTARKRPSASRPVDRQSVERELARAAGSTAFEHRDPLFHVTESFHQSFDRLGRKHAAERMASTDSEHAGGEERKMPAGTFEKGDKPLLPGTQLPLQRFSEVAFQRGNLSAAVLQGSGKMMLVSCLKRTVGQSGPKNPQMRTLFGTGSQRRNVPGRDPDQMLFNRGFAGSAVGLVVDTLRDARRTVLSMQEMAEGTGELKAAEGGVTLRAMYPFLDDSQERELLEKYTAQLADCTDGRERPILQNALVHTRSLLDRKAQMRVEFINKLRFLADRATEALAEFEAPGFAESVAAALLEEEPEPPAEPPEDPNKGGYRHGAADRADRPSDGSEDRAADGAGEEQAD